MIKMRDDEIFDDMMMEKHDVERKLMNIDAWGAEIEHEDGEIEDNSW